MRAARCGAIWARNAQPTQTYLICHHLTVVLRACAACHRFLPQRSCKASCSLVLSAARRSLVLVSLKCVCEWVSWPSGHVARAMLRGLLWGVGTSFGRGFKWLRARFARWGKQSFASCSSFAGASFVVVGLLRCSRRVRVGGVAFAGSACSGGVPAAASSIVLVAVGGRARRPAPAVVCVFRRGRWSWATSRSEPRGCLLCGVDMRTRVAVWPLVVGGLGGQHRGLQNRNKPTSHSTRTHPRMV